MVSRLMTATLSVVLASTAAALPSRATPVSDVMLLEEAFGGNLTGRGAFVSKLAGIERPFTVKTRGTWDGKTLVFEEDFFYDDGERDNKTWRFTKVAPDRYEGTREDLVGKAIIRTYPDRITLKYLIDLPRGDGTMRLRFSDIITRNPDGTLRNVARVSKFGFRIGTVDLTFRRTP